MNLSFGHSIFSIKQKCKSLQTRHKLCHFFLVTKVFRFQGGCQHRPPRDVDREDVQTKHSLLDAIRLSPTPVPIPFVLVLYKSGNHLCLNCSDGLQVFLLEDSIKEV